ncbi:MAG: class I SAM-dependent methyltransferase [Magnetovibrio sp.]|nr:class I SAM-dependent methyltransferase [Magnetovibrio sp.]
MSKRSLTMTDDLYAYMLENSLREPPILAELRAETAGMPRSGMQIAPEQGQFMALLVELTDAARYLEVGTFTGYSALAVALALPDHGEVVTCDVDPETTAVAQRYWARAGMAKKIDLRLGPAVDTLDALLGDGAGRFDFAFIDADKENYVAYYERAVELVRPGGLIALDNVLWSGRVADPANNDTDTEALRAVNRRVHADDRVSVAMLPLADGLTLARKR